MKGAITRHALVSQLAAVLLVEGILLGLSDRRCVSFTSRLLLRKDFDEDKPEAAAHAHGDEEADVVCHGHQHDQVVEREADRNRETRRRRPAGAHALLLQGARLDSLAAIDARRGDRTKEPHAYNSKLVLAPFHNEEPGASARVREASGRRDKQRATKSRDKQRATKRVVARLPLEEDVDVAVLVVEIHVHGVHAVTIIVSHGMTGMIRRVGIIPVTGVIMPAVVVHALERVKVST